MAKHLQGPGEQAGEQLARAGEALAAGRLREADGLSQALLKQHPDDPDALHLMARIRARMGDHAGALNAIRQALALRPDDAAFLLTCGVQLAAAGQLDAAIGALRRACSLEPGWAVAWYNLGVLQVRAVRFAQAEASLRKALELAPGNLTARLQIADLLKMAGHVEEAATSYREALADHPACGDAWWGLAGLGATALGDDDLPAMQAALRDPRASERDRIALGFAIARVLDRNDRPEQVMGVLKETHGHARQLQQWDARAFESGLEAILAAFASVASGSPEASLGHGVLFIVSLPRSGSTLVEQILASHSAVEGSGELHDLPQVLVEESGRRGSHYPDWVASMTPDDWQRLGKRYMERTARWRRHGSFSTDKLPGNWLHVGAIRAMLPGAKVVVCRRDPVETCFACYRQYMAADGQGWSHRFEDLAAYWTGFDRAVRQWQKSFPGFVHEHVYEDLLADPERNVRELLTFCGLSFEDACLAFHGNAREVRSPTAAQVREPLRRDMARAPRYGARLDPLRRALGCVDIISAH